MKLPTVVLICLAVLLTACLPQAGDAVSIARPTVTPIVETESILLEPEPTPTLEAYPPVIDYPTPVYPQMSSPTAVPPSGRPIQQITSSDQVTLPQDLIYLENSKLMRWRTNGQIEVLAGPLAQGNAAIIQPVSSRLGPGPAQFDGAVRMYDVAADGRALVYLRWRSQGRSELVRYDLETGETAVLTLVEAVQSPESNEPPTLLALTVSPDGRWVAYMTENIGQRAGKPSGYASMNYVPAYGDLASGTVWVINAQNPQQPQEIGQCEAVNGTHIITHCGQRFTWSSDSQQLYWTDTSGVWQTSVADWQANVLLSNNIDNLDHGTGVSIYSILSADPSNQYLLLQVSAYEGGSQAILNVVTGAFIDVPNSGAYVNPGPELSWLADGRLFAVRGSEYEGGDQPPILEIWRIAGDELVRDAGMLLPVSTYGLPREPGQLADGRLTFIFISQNEQEHGIYVADFATLTAQRISDIAPTLESYYTAHTHWLASGDGLLFEDSYNRYLFYIPGDGSGVFDLLPLFFDFPYSFTWLPS